MYKSHQRTFCSVSGALVLDDSPSENPEVILGYPVLKLNKNWQAIETVTVKDAFSSMFAGGLKALRFEEELVGPVSLEEWLSLGIRDNDHYVRTPCMRIRVPRVVIAVRYSKLYIRAPKLTLSNLRARDNDTCVYTGRRLSPSEMSIEHIVPTSKNGKHEWENVALADRMINSNRGNKELSEAGLIPRFKPFAPSGRRPEEQIKNIFEFPEWEMFVKTQ